MAAGSVYYTVRDRGRCGAGMPVLRMLVLEMLVAGVCLHAQTREVKPPRTPSNQGFRVAIMAGINILAWSDYRYSTSVNLSQAEQFNYLGGRGAPGVTVFGGAAVSLPGALRRLTVGAHFDAGGLYSLSRSVIPDGAATPFSAQNLQSAIQLQHTFGQGWNPGFAAYVEHDIGTLFDSRLRAGYQYWRQSGSYTGTFPPNFNSFPAGYNVELNDSSQMIRVSLNNDLFAKDIYGNPQRRARRKTGLVRQAGIAVGTHKTIMVFFGIGPVWAF